MVYFKTTPYETEENWEIIQERDLKKAVLGNYCRGFRGIRRKLENFCVMLHHRTNTRAARS